VLSFFFGGFGVCGNDDTTCAYMGSNGCATYRRVVVSISFRGSARELTCAPALATAWAMKRHLGSIASFHITLTLVGMAAALHSVSF